MNACRCTRRLSAMAFRVRGLVFALCVHTLQDLVYTATIQADVDQGLHLTICEVRIKGGKHQWDARSGPEVGLKRKPNAASKTMLGMIRVQMARIELLLVNINRDQSPRGGC